MVIPSDLSTFSSMVVTGQKPDYSGLKSAWKVGGKQDSVIWRLMEREQNQGRSIFKRRDRQTYRLRTKPRGERTVEDSGQSSNTEGAEPILYPHTL